MRSAVIACFVAALIAPTAAGADDEKNQRKVHVLEQRPFLRALRVEVQPSFGLTVNEVLYRYMQAAGSLRVHITEEWSVGGNFGWYFADTTKIFQQVQDEFALFPEKSFVRWYAGGEVNWSPLYGKGILFGSAIMNWSFYLSVGGGVTKTLAQGLRPTGMLGFGARIFLTDWLTWNFEVRDHLYTEPFKAGDELINNVVLFSGFGVFIPFGFDYVHRR